MRDNLARGRKTIAYLSLLAALFSALSARGLATEGQYFVAQEFSLHQKENGIEGTLRLSMDKRLTRNVQEELWGHGEWSFVFPRESSLYRDFSSLPPVKARLSIADLTGKIRAQRDLDRALARLDSWSPMGGSNRVFLIAQEFGVPTG